VTVLEGNVGDLLGGIVAACDRRNRNENISHYDRTPGRDLKAESPEHEAGPTPARCVLFGRSASVNNIRVPERGRCLTVPSQVQASCHIHVMMNWEGSGWNQVIAATFRMSAE
jgi:hypothetical protein